MIVISQALPINGIFLVKNDFSFRHSMSIGAGCVQLWIRSAEPPGEQYYTYENWNNKNHYMTKAGLGTFNL